MHKKQQNIVDPGTINGTVEFEEFELSNGLQVILSKDDSIPTVAINLCYHVGSKDEEPDKRGFAHLFEHLMFEGSKNLPTGEYDRICVSAGGENNAYTSEDKTNYFVLLPSHQLEKGLWLESDRMLGFAVSQESFDKQRDVIREEKKQVFDNRPYGTTSLEFMPRLFKSGGYSWDTIGDMNDLASATLDDVRDFYEKYYVPNNAILTIVGDFEQAETKNLIEKYFGSIPGGARLNKKRYEDTRPEKEIRDTIYDNIQSPGVFMGYRIPAENGDHYFELDVLSDILASGDSSRLYNELVYELQFCSEVGCYVDPKEFAGIFYIYAILMPGVKIEQVEKEIERIIGDIKACKISETETLKVKNRMETRFIYRKQSILSKAEYLTHYKMFFNETDLINTNIRNYEHVTPKKISEAAIKFLDKNNRVVLYYLPRAG